MLRFRFVLPIVSAAVLFCLASVARADDSLFTVKGVHVDASAASVSVAQSIAMAQGRPHAWQTLYRRLVRQEDWGKQPQLDDTQLQRIIRSFYVANERRSTTRYVADVTFDFNSDAVGKILKTANIAYAQSAAKRILLIPMNPTFSRGSMWTQAFTAPRFANSQVPFSLPGGDALDREALGSLSLDQASWMDVEPIAQVAHVNEAVLVLAQANNGKLTLTLKRIGAGEVPTKTTINVPYVQGLTTTYPAAADAAIAAIAELWKQKSALDFSQKGRLTADVRISSLAQWASLQSSLASVPNISGVSILAMNIGEARIAIAYLGTTDQLRDALGQASLQLVANGNAWTLKPGPPPAPVTPPANTGQ